VGICPPSLAAEGGPVFLEYLNITQAVIPDALTTLAIINTGESGMQLSIVVCSFVNVPVGYDLKVRPDPDATANKHFWRGSNTAGFVREIPAGSTEFWEFGLRPREEWVVEGEADLAASLALTISVAQVFNSGAPEVCPPATTAVVAFTSGFSNGYL
jgi:hypothetical protein